MSVGSHDNRVVDDVTRSRDPRLIAARLFIGNCPTDKITKQDVEERFSRHGEILGISLLKGFGFIQFKEIEDAKVAVQVEHGQEFHGNRLDIRLANEGRRQPQGGDFQHPYARGPRPDAFASRPRFDAFPGQIRPVNQFQQPQDLFSRMRFPSTNLVGPQLGVNTALVQQQYAVRPPNVGGPPPAAGFQPTTILPMQPTVGPLVGAPTIQQPPPPQQQPLPGTPSTTTTQPTTQAPPPPVVRRTGDVGLERPYDGAILVVNKECRPYAELVERRLIELNMNIDVVFLINPTKSSTSLETLAKKGLLYVVTVQKEHQEHKSVTVNVLHGTPEEHRNMPLDDALLMLSKDFTGYLTKLRSGSELPSLNFLLHLLADGRNLSRPEVERIATHLRQRHEKLSDMEGTAPTDQQQQNQPVIEQKVEEPKPGVQQAQQSPAGPTDLHRRIMTMLGASKAPSTTVAQPTSAPTAATVSIGGPFTRAPPPILTTTTTAANVYSQQQPVGATFGQMPVSAVAAAAPRPMQQPGAFNPQQPFSYQPQPSATPDASSGVPGPMTPDLQKALQSLLQNPALKSRMPNASALVSNLAASSGIGSAAATPLQQQQQPQSAASRIAPAVQPNQEQRDPRLVAQQQMTSVAASQNGQQTISYGSVYQQYQQQKQQDRPGTGGGLLG